MIRNYIRFDTNGVITVSGRMEENFIQKEIDSGELIAFADDHHDVDGTKIFNATTKEITNAPIIPPTLAELKAKKIEDLASIRYVKEVSSIVWNGNTFETDRESQSKYSSTLIMFTAGSITTVSWKTATGSFVDLTKDNFTNLCGAIFAYIQNCFANEKTIAANISSASNETSLNAVDLTIGYFPIT